jgi:hypothetical protein
MAIFGPIGEAQCVLDFGRPSISVSIRSIKMDGLNVQHKKDWCVVEMYPEEQGFGPST